MNIQVHTWIYGTLKDTVYEGEWKDDKAHGITNGATYEGEFGTISV